MVPPAPRIVKLRVVETGAGSRTQQAPAQHAEARTPSGHADTSEETPAAAPAMPGTAADLTSGKRLCSRWLDGLFQALYADLKVFTEWTIEEEEARAQGRGQGRARSTADWRCLGALAERLMQLQEAEMAYRNCVRDRFQASVWERLMWMYTDAHYVNEPLICAAQLCNYHTLQFDETVQISKEKPPIEVQKAVCKLVARVGLRRAETAIADPATGSMPTMMPAMLQHCKTWSTFNFDA